MSNKLILTLLTAICIVSSAYGQNPYPNKPITIIVPHPTASAGIKAD